MKAIIRNFDSYPGLFGQLTVFCKHYSKFPILINGNDLLFEMDVPFRMFFELLWLCKVTKFEMGGELYNCYTGGGNFGKEKEEH